ncbi:hypothetical protein Tel_15505 [Candidatus Tenderia electrophaga]|uniref:diguanylate cyclase n=1 Tax=Candidatus Tenderia electrophaga TaxID=1748243 RepID=A0A0S2TH09_9GAMM|nr:hypothetical protein Tel_15505 [Candidatus Tenderia electrophaga]
MQYVTTPPLSLIAIDLDHFKAINDQYNHQVGDAVLKEFVHLVQKLLRPSDLLSRTGGEEFAVLLPDTDLEEAGQIAERLRQRLEHCVLAVERQQIRVTISLGVAQYHHPNETIKDWFNSADTLLYRAKRNGRNRVEVEPH